MAEKREEEAPAIPSQNLGDKKSDSDKKVQSDSRLKKTEEPVEELETTTTTHKSKKRRKCPAALEKFQEFDNNSNRSCFSFSFDTKISSGGTPESTPKFGSFNLAGELGLLKDTNSSSSTTTTQPEEEVEFDLLGFSEINPQGDDEEEEEEEDKRKTEIEGSIPIVLKSTD